jgi:archaellum biogenesis ATPase FlaH/biotin operon repressor
MSSAAIKPLRQVSRSRPPSSRNAGNVVPLHGLPEPGPRHWLLEGLVPAGAITILSGHSDLGKSYVALRMAYSVLTGQDFLGLRAKKHHVLWVDRELDQEETLRRAYAVARGMGLAEIPEGLFYLKPMYPVGHEETQRVILNAVKQHDVGLVILDSLSVGSQGDMGAQRDIVSLLKMIEEWGTVIAIDHITKREAAGNQSYATIFGSTFKRAIARSTLVLTKADSGGRLLRHDKSNFSNGGESIGFLMEFSENDKETMCVSFVRVDTDHPSMSGMKGKDPYESTLNSLLTLYSENFQAVSLAALAKARGVSEKTVRNHLTKLKKDGLVEGHKNNTYSPA